MKALDTNVLVRLLTDDDVDMRARAVGIIEVAESSGEPLRVPLLVVLELVWVLRSRYNYVRGDIVAAIERLLTVGGLQFEAPECVREFASVAAKGSLDLPDVLIGLSALNRGCRTTLTFDRRAAASRVVRGDAALTWFHVR